MRAEVSHTQLTEQELPSYDTFRRVYRERWAGCMRFRGDCQHSRCATCVWSPAALGELRESTGPLGERQDILGDPRRSQEIRAPGQVLEIAPRRHHRGGQDSLDRCSR